MNLDFVNGRPLAPPRTLAVIPSGRFAGSQIGEMNTDDLRALQVEFFRRDPAVQRAIVRELSRRDRSRQRRHVARVSIFSHRLEQARA